MAGDWIKMRGNLWDDPRVAKIVDLTDSSEAAVIGALYWLWATADQHTEDGIMPGLTLKSIDRKTGVQGFAQALIDIYWLADHPEGVRIVEFEKHNGSSAKKRLETAKRVANHRSGNTSNTDVTQEALQKQLIEVTGALARVREELEEEKSKKEIPSVTDVTGGKPPLKPDEIIFGYGLPILTNAGTPEKQARSFLGGLRKAHGDDALVNTLRECIRAKPLQPLEWLAKAMLPDATGVPAETRYQKSKREQMERDFPNLTNKPESCNVVALELD